MYFIYSLVLWAVLFIAATIGKEFAVNSDLITTLIVFQILTSVSFIGFLITAFFYQLDWTRGAQRRVSKIKRLKREVELEEEKYKELKIGYEKYLGEDYPNMEKEIFGKIAEFMPWLQNFKVGR